MKILNQDVSGNKCDVLLVFVNDNERDAIFKAVKSIRIAPKPIASKTFTYHSFGEIGGAKVLGLQTRMGAVNRGAAGPATLEAINEVDPDYIIAVGVAFGMDNKKQQIGDVLVSEKIATYEPRKIGSKKKRIGQVKYERSRGETPAVPERLFSKIRAMAAYWEKAPVHFGLLLSGEKLIDDADFKEKLKKEYPEAIGGEMEAAGIYASSELKKRDWIIIKAVCDYADGNKGENKKENQKAAAENAADFIFKALTEGLFGRESADDDTTIEDEAEEVTQPPQPQRSTPQIKEQIKKEITQILKESQLKPLYEDLKDFIKENKKKIIIKDEAVLAEILIEILIDYDVLKAISILDRATDSSLKRIKKEVGQQARLREIWDGAVNILGWLVLLSVNYEWIKGKKGDFDGSLKIKFEIPVKTEAGVEIVYSYIRGSSAKLSVDKSGNERVSGNNTISCDRPEGGWDTEDAFLDIAKLIWAKVSPEDPPKSTKLTKDDLIYLNRRIAIRNEKGEHYYLLSVNCKNNNLSNIGEKEYKKLKAVLPALPIVFMTIDASDDESEKIFIVIEKELEAQLIEFLLNKNKPE